MNRWAVLASWIVPPLGMLLAYSVLAWSSETDTTGKAWMAVGFGFVLVLWLVFRILVEQTAVSRAVASGDADRILAITEQKLARRRGDAARAPYLVYRALAHDLRGEHAAVLATLADARPTAPRLQLLAAALRVIALVETGERATARRVADDELAPRVAELDERLHAQAHIYASLARGRLLLAEGAHAEARTAFGRVIADVRAGEPIRARARELAARAASCGGLRTRA